jgi:amidase
MEDLRWASAVTQARALKDGLFTSAELHDMTVQLIESVDPLVRAVVIPLFDRPGLGVPMLVKDAGQEIAGAPHWLGVAALRDANARSAGTTSLVRRFEGGGFSVIGKGACPQLSSGATTEPPGFEPTRNPWDLSRSTGGSSGGPAAAVAAGMVPIAHGSDATGSLRTPAALCGVATLNPTSGRIASVPPAGQPPNDAWRDFVIARHSEDLAMVFDLLTGSTTPRAFPALRVGLLDHDPELGLQVHDSCQNGVRKAGLLLEGLGHHVEASWPEALNNLWAAAFEAFGVVSDAVRPSTVDWVGARLGRPVEPGELQDWVFEAVERDRARSPEEVRAAEAIVAFAIAPIHTWWEDHDILVTPASFQPAWPLGAAIGPAQVGTLLAPFSLTGQPALSLPLHHTDDGLPVGVQLVGRRGFDEVLLRLAEDLQAAHDWTARRPPTS